MKATGSLPSGARYEFVLAIAVQYIAMQYDSSSSIDGGEVYY